MSDNVRTIVTTYPSAFSESSSAPNLGIKLGRYRLISVVGRGGSATVYKAHDESLDRYVAVKVLTNGEFASEDLKSRFKREIQIQAKLDLPGVIRIFEVGDEDGWLYYSMEIIDGLPVDQYAEQFEHWQDIIKLSVQLCNVVAHLHRKGLCHRDIKPGNVMVDNHGQVKLLDFGLVKPVKAESNIYQTMQGGCVGTPAYMSPEQTMGSLNQTSTAKKNNEVIIHQATDVYALSVLIYQLLTRQLPYDLDYLSISEIAEVIRNSKPKAPSSFHKGIPVVIDRLILQGLSKDPGRRPTVVQFAKELLEGTHLPSVQKRWGIVVLGFAGTMVLAFGMYWKHQPIDSSSSNQIQQIVGHPQMTQSQPATTRNAEIVKDEERKFISEDDAIVLSNLATKRAIEIVRKKRITIRQSPLIMVPASVAMISEDKELKDVVKNTIVTANTDFSTGEIMPEEGMLVYSISKNQIIDLSYTGSLLIENYYNKFQQIGRLRQIGSEPVLLEITRIGRLDKLIFEWIPQAGKVDVLY